MNEIEISVIIPTYNRKDVLIKCLKALFCQSYSKKYEILIIDDGSSDNTEKVVEELQKNAPIELRYFKQENKGPAAARNIGIKNANGDIILFIGDDIIASSELLEQHMLFHRKYSESVFAILGYTTWHPEIKITPFMYWLEHGGPQFGYYKFKHEEEVNAFWTCNISLKRDYMLKNGIFDEDFPYAAHEDTELGYRLQKKGLRTIFNKNAVTYHYHPTDIKKYCYRQKLVGRSAVILNRKYTSVFELPKPKVWKRIPWNVLKPAIPCLEKFTSWVDQRGITFPYLVYAVIMGYYYQVGIREMLNEYAKDVVRT